MKFLLIVFDECAFSLANAFQCHLVVILADKMQLADHTLVERRQSSSSVTYLDDLRGEVAMKEPVEPEVEKLTEPE
jgi:hypothetical protein